MEIFSIILWGILGLGIVVFIHELGHFIAARLVHIDVDTFSLGWGKKLIGFKYKDTTYQIAWFPIGGYCKMKGEHVLKEAFEKKLTEIPKEPGSYFGAPPWKRIIVSFFGPLANLIFAVLVLTVLFWIGYTEISAENRIVLASYFLTEEEYRDLPAAKAGLRTGDRVLSIDNIPVRHFNDLHRIIYSSPGKELHFLIERDDGKHEITVVPYHNNDTNGGAIGITAWQEPIISSIGANMSSLNPWLKESDKIISINNEPVAHNGDVLRAIYNKPESINVTILRKNEIINRVLVLAYNKNGDPLFDIDFLKKEYQTPRLNFLKAFAKAFKEAVNIIVKSLEILTKPLEIIKNIAGPLRITHMIGGVGSGTMSIGIKGNLISFFYLIAFISTVLMFMNLLPIPVLDGGFICLFTYEAITKKPLSLKLVSNFQLIGVVFILALLLLAISNDIFYFLNI